MTLVLKHGDCLELMRDLSDNSVDLIICDLPYGCLAQQKGATPFGRNVKGPSNSGCSWDEKIDLAAFWKEVKRIRRNDHSPCIHFCTTRFGYELIASNPDEFRYDLVWDKQKGVSFLSANKMPMRSHEMIYVFSKKGAYYKRLDEDKACVKSVITIQKVGVKTQKHPTEKLVSLYRWLLERYCPPGGTVLDPTFGSGNSVFTAYDMGLHAIGFEKDETFYKKAVGRIPSEDIIQHL